VTFCLLWFDGPLAGLEMVQTAMLEDRASVGGPRTDEACRAR
jgi:hypothetical protein